MPSPRVQHLRLGNGLHLTQLHAPWLNRGAAALRIGAGSHDEPPQYPGLAHFLEHLVFLGSRHFAAQDGLLPLTMEHGGQANASTRERHTDYFFELPTAAVDAGLARLCDMLAAPTLDLRQQHAEREVLHAEYLAWSRDDLSAASRALAEAVPARHPLARCHAGERASLALQQEGFQQALRRFHRDFYHAGQARLVLLGPQPPEQLRELAEREGNRLRAATPTPRPPPPALLPPRHSRVAMARPGLCLLFTLQQLPDGAAPALQWLCQQLQHDAPGGWAASLAERGLGGPVQASLAYHHQDQALLQLDLGSIAADGETAVLELLFDWLAFFARQDWGALSTEHRRWLARQACAVEPLGLLRHWLQAGETPSLDEAVLREILPQLHPGNLLRLVGRCGALAPSASAPPHWQLPPANPWLQQRGPNRATASPEAAGLRREHLPGGHGHGALLLRWQAAPGCSPPGGLLQGAVQALATTTRRAGLELGLSSGGELCELRLSGPAPLLPDLLRASLDALDNAPLPQPAPTPSPSAAMFLRRLWQRLESELTRQLHPPGDPVRLSDCRRDGLALGLDDAQWHAVCALWNAAPGQAGRWPSQRPRLEQRLWLEVEPMAGEQALLLFVPSGQGSAAEQAAARLLGQWLQAPFHHHWRQRLGLGYGVFAGHRRLAGLDGLLFAVQSPYADAHTLLGHVQAFIDAQRVPLAGLDLARQRELLLARLAPAKLAPGEAATLLWQLGDDAGQLQRLREAVAALDSEALDRALLALGSPAAGCFCLATGAPADSRWRPSA
ncbi:pyrroloquinoline quinone biosynthesis protein PqqF [Pseudomonas aeruginosa]|jgi:coenzyme PQQ biosynthesis probable peptidase PqqF|uniref:Coenzyme PQQ synthesis protein F n=2 Tax=Pseudomonadaceae TaxID=135621 RepID=A0AA42PDU9_STUST|nr:MULTISPECIES: pyrroloquinoline quinone biosynthesis protein PqqF [Pseudomonadaceae]MBC9053351.1 pyrroloquinoline quinone biosynthesis protein PqqF [Pseudomonas aeruginosa]MBH3356416.1 pyrroloquinoline quinone biosynthesis protein PqqF [Stutzerimonas stutzeri]MCO2440793.1 pyrroloquinoline quinone biosynthesis protein PqqF [Pseudomonas aeruginosa]MDH1238420.1 pyrroloquinoline quinone biosynthesis protein PqqF [Stutzerimonas stutzeri]RPM82202.1 pyrroloquinoline quinone biosynthesis protein Pqq